MRPDGRKPDELRPVNLESGYLDLAEGSCLASAGKTRVLCAASFEKRVPSFLSGTGQGWITAEYALLPRSTHHRTPREWEKPRGRTQEIRRFIGRALRAVCDLSALGERQIIIDCDVIQADGGTRTLALTGGFCALEQAIKILRERGEIERSPIIEHVAATSVGKVNGKFLLDLVYEEDSRADVDMNLALTETGRIVEIQATAEGTPIAFDELHRLYDLASNAIGHLIKLQHACAAKQRRGNE
ncbi:ribonuclease PH [candidate division WOR-3 bacterium JGI_Cruoil_03_51_56]|uniref:Ribonuclease PH n=1 Tax=candidate division WOR-3 bacterium JGI_Cruoil_03_51_56 TaxID=1973747 RepID=A0A235BUD6_UNCW3|nr:MAG: ribonuclease PH [candidate division WOR-3 bacterium JGI_Cruoil_03_51_56]